MKNVILLAILFLIIQVDSRAQNILSPPPSSSSHVKMIDNPVDLHTGVPDISIPLHTIQGKKLAYPVSISYNASGIKVSEVAGIVGLGWSLNAPGIITRTVRGKPDEWPNSYFAFAGSIPNETDQIPESTLFALADGDYDMQPDLFYYSTGMQAGKFMFDNQLQPQTIPKTQLKITFNNTTTLSDAIITTYDGTRYIYEEGEKSASVGYYGTSTLTYISSWYLSKIISPDNTDTIRFNYTATSSTTYQATKNGYLHFFYDIDPAKTAHRAQYEVENTFGSETVSVSGTRFLESIESSKGKVTFQLGTRTDKQDLKKLERITIYRKDPFTRTYIEDRRFNLNYTYFTGTGGSSDTRLKLEGIQEAVGTSITNPPYQFFYSSKQLPPPSSAAQDPWGYFNGATANESLVPATTFLGQEISTSNRNLSPYYVDGCMLSSIISPLGGITEYTFENNRYGSGNAYGPGMRISKITVKDPYSNIDAVTNYEYLNPNTGTTSGVLLHMPSFAQTHLPVEDVMHGDTLNYKCMLIPVGSTGIGTYESAPLVYEYVTVYKGNDYNVSGKTTTKFSVAEGASQTFPYYISSDLSWKSGNPTEISHFKVEAGISTLVNNTINQFEEHPTYTSIKGLNAAWTKLYIIQTPQVSSVSRKTYSQEAKFSYQKESNKYHYEQNSGTISSLSTQTFYYDRTDGYYLLNRITSTTSEDNLIHEKEFTYPVDYPSTGVFSEMQGRYMISYPVETRHLTAEGSNEYLIGYEKTDYALWGAEFVYPKDFYLGRFTSPVLKNTFLANPSQYVQKISSLKYNASGFPVETQQVGGTPTAVIIDDFHGAPIANITNAQTNQVAYTSFETKDYGGWTMDAGSQTATKSVSLYANGQTTSVTIESAQTINYTYTIVRTQGEPVELIFSKGTEQIIQGMSMPSGSGSVDLTPGTWSASLHFETNVSSADVDFSYTYTKYLEPNILDNDSKTGTNVLYLTSPNTISKTGLPAGNYNLSYYQKGGTVNLALTGGAALLQSELQPASADGFQLVRKLIQITDTSNTIQLTGSNIKVDELRLYPEASLIKTTCYDAFGRAATETDINLQSTFYEYDELDRLRLIRDHEQNIIQHYEYKLAGN
ncbi:MAG: hypothetical protein WA874_05795 [Chryseosolibacter sp.]